MDPLLTARLEALEKKIDAIYVSVEKTRKYLFWTAVVTIVVVVLPLLFLPFAIGQLMTYVGQLSSLGL